MVHVENDVTILESADKKTIMLVANNLWIFMGVLLVKNMCSIWKRIYGMFPYNQSGTSWRD